MVEIWVTSNFGYLSSETTSFQLIMSGKMPNGCPGLQNDSRGMVPIVDVTHIADRGASRCDEVIIA
jgi:hypothetical protein